MSRIRKIELLAPAKNYETAVAAIDWGADAVYMGGPGFGARYAAGNSVEDVARVVEYASRYRVRVYATLNTIVYDNELKEAERIARELIDAGVDAIIVQDMAYMEMGLEGVEFHASTQTFNATPEKVRFLEQAGFSRVILERGLSLEQIKDIREATDVELECFVHGAICVGYSGRCWLSRTMSSRSGNRGECSQACRQTYDLVDSSGNVVLKNKHLLSVQDLDLSARIPELLDAGITSFKIEGRLKDLNYVKNTVGYYRNAIDEQLPSREGMLKASSGKSVTEFVPDLSKTFTRGRSEYVFGGKHRGIASFDTPKAIGESLGMVMKAGSGWYELKSSEGISTGDGICFIGEDGLVGTNLNKVEDNRIYPNRFYDIKPGTDIYRNYDRLFSTGLEKASIKRVLDVNVQVALKDGVLSISLEDEDGFSANATYSNDFEPANNPDKILEMIPSQIAKTGDTIFRVNDIVLEVECEVPFIPVSVINNLRREVFSQLLSARISTLAERNIAIKREDISYPFRVLDGTENVVNELAKGFYRKHGVERIEAGLDLQTDMEGSTVMRTPYCIRREIGECLKERYTIREGLWLEHGLHRYRLDFDCAKCEMKVIYEGKR